MSLINDALKRAQQARQQNPFGNQPVPLQPVEYGRRPDWVFRALVGLCLVASLAGAGWCLWKWWRTGGESQGGVVVANVAQAASASGGTKQGEAPPSHAHLQANHQQTARHSLS